MLETHTYTHLMQHTIQHTFTRVHMQEAHTYTDTNTCMHIDDTLMHKPMHLHVCIHGLIEGEFTIPSGFSTSNIQKMKIRIF